MQRLIYQGDLYWVRVGPNPDIAHPHVVIQDDLLNHSRLSTVVMCALTTNLNKASIPGTVLLDVGEGGLPKPSLIEASKLSSVEKADLGAYIGKLAQYRIDQIFAALRLLQSLS